MIPLQHPRSGRARRTALALAGALAATGGAAVPAAAVAPGALDTSFSGDGLAALNPPTRLGGVVVSPAGKIYATGQTVGGTTRVILARLSSNGAVDGGFPKLGPNPPSGGGIGRAVALQPDGKVVVVGSATGTGSGILIERFTADGAPDASFGGGDGLADVQLASLGAEGYGVAIQGDGKIVAVGSARASDGYSRIALVRLNSNGSPDTSFGFQGAALGQLPATGECSVPGRAVDCLRQSVGRGAAVQTDGKIVVAGYSQFNLQTRDGVVARFNSNGSLDGSYSGDGVARLGAGTFGGGAVEFRAIALQPDNKAVVTGMGATGASAGSIPAVTPIARFSTSGNPDGSFSGDGITIFPAARGSSVSSDSRVGAFGIGLARNGNIVAGGSFFDSGLNVLAAWSADAAGNPAAFGSGGTAVARLPGATNGFGNAVAVGLDGNPVVAGEASSAFGSNNPAGLVARFGGFGPLVVPANPRSVQVILSRRLVPSSRGRASFTIINKNTGGSVRVSATLVSKSKIKVGRKRKSVTFAKASATIPARARRSVALNLNRGNLALLRRLKRVSVTLTVTVTANGKKNVIRKTTRLDAPRGRRR